MSTVYVITDTIVFLDSSTPTVVKFFQNWAPYLSVILSIIVLAVGRFIWNNRNSVDQNKKRLSRLGRVIFGDDENVSRPGLVEKLDEIDSRLDELERRINELEDD